MKKLSRTLLSRLSVALALIAVGVYIWQAPLDKTVSVAVDHTKYDHYQVVLLDKDMMLVPFTVQVRQDLTMLEQLNMLLGLMKTNQTAAPAFRGFLDSDVVVNKATIKNRTMALDFNSAFLKYQKEHELKILEALLFVAMQFEHVDQLSLLVDHFPLQYMPMKNTVVNQPITRKLGINNFINQADSLNNSTGIVVFYAKTIDGKQYLVPQTKRINHQKVTMEVLLQEIVDRVFVSSLVDQPLHSERIVFVKPPLVKGKELTVYFDTDILVEERTIDDVYVQLLLLSIRSNSAIERVKIMVGEDAVGLGGMNDDFIEVDSILYNYLFLPSE